MGVVLCETYMVLHNTHMIYIFDTIYIHLDYVEPLSYVGPCI